MIPQNLFRRHRHRSNRDDDGIEGGATSTSENTISSSPQRATDTDTTPTTTREDSSASTSNNAAADDAQPTNNNISSNDQTSGRLQDEDEEQELIVSIPNDNNTNSIISSGIRSSFLSLPFDQSANEQTAQIQQQQRREAILKEVERVQRANFIHFVLLCLVPTSLLLIVIAAIVSEDGECGGEEVDGLMVCEREARSFVNAFTTRCICDAVKTSPQGMGLDDDDDA